jgi:hypothetical protein
MASLAVSSQGTKIYIGDFASPNQFTAIPGVTGISGPSAQANLIDVTDLDSTAKEFLPGLKDEGEITLDLNWTPDNTVHQSLRSNFTNRTKKTFALDFSDTAPVTRWQFDGYITQCQISGAVDNALKAQVTIKITGAIVETNQ